LKKYFFAVRLVRFLCGRMIAWIFAHMTDANIINALRVTSQGVFMPKNLERILKKVRIF